MPRVDPVIRALDLGLASMSDVCRVLVRATDWLAASDRPQTMQRFAGRFGGNGRLWRQTYSGTTSTFVNRFSRSCKG